MTRLGEIHVPCKTCKLARQCRLSSNVHRDAVFAWAKGLPSVDCHHYQPALYRGIEGVFTVQPVKFNKYC